MKDLLIVSLGGLVALVLIAGILLYSDCVQAETTMCYWVDNILVCNTY